MPGGIACTHEEAAALAEDRCLRGRLSSGHAAPSTLVQTVAGKLRVGTMGDVGRLPGQPAGSTPDQLPVAPNGFNRPLRYAAFQAHAGWIFPRRRLCSAASEISRSQNFATSAWLGLSA